MTERILFLSVIIPTCNRPVQLAACLQALSDQDYPRDGFEVIVVDDGSQVRPENPVRSFADRMNILLVSQENAGPASARNTGAARAQGAYLAFTDDDCRPASDWLSRLAECFVDESDCAVAGRTVNALKKNIYATAAQLLIDFLNAFYNRDPEAARFFTTSNMAIPTARFQAIGGFDTTFPKAAGEDRELCERWLRLGNRVLYEPAAGVYHAHNMTFRTFMGQQFNYGRAAFRYHYLRARHRQKPLKIENYRFYASLFCYPLSKGWQARNLLLTGLFVFSQMAIMAGFGREWLKK